MKILRKSTETSSINTGKRKVKKIPYQNEHACRLKDPDTLDIVGSEERKHDEKTYRVIFGKEKDGNGGSVEQAYRYPKDTWDVDDARSHCASHDGKFEAASDNVKEGRALLLFGSTPTLKEGKISGRAIHPVTTFHNEFPVLRKFVAEHLKKAIQDSKFPIPIVIDHGLPLDFTKNKITELRWHPDTLEVEYFGDVDDLVAEDITNGLYKNGVSIEIGFPPGSGIDFVDAGTAIAPGIPRGFRYEAVSLLKNMVPSDPSTNIKVWNNAVAPIIESLTQNNKTKNGENNMKTENSESYKIVYAAVKKRASELKEQGMTKDEVCAKIAELQTQLSAIDEQLYPSPEPLSDEKRAELDAQQATLWAEIQAYEEALAELTKEEVVTDVKKPDGTGPPPDEERAKTHFGKTDEEWAALSEAEKQEYIDKLPPLGNKRIGQATPTTKEECEAAGGTWNTEDSTCKMPEPPASTENEGEDADEMTKEKCEAAGGTWDAETNTCKTPEPPPENLEQTVPTMKEDCEAAGGTWNAETQTCTPKKKVLGEAILGAGDPQQPVGYVSVEALERILPHPNQHIDWGMRTHFVDPLRRLIYEAKKKGAQQSG